MSFNDILNQSKKLRRKILRLTEEVEELMRLMKSDENPYLGR